MCSSDFGPARLPSFVTWPMRNVVMPRPLARNRSCVATSRTWLMLPGADWNFDEYMVCTESTTSAAGFSVSTCSRMRSRDVSASEEQPAARDAEPLAAQLDLPLGFLARHVEDGAVRAPEQVGDLEQQRALADPGLAADQHHRAGHDPAAQHAVELADAGGNARRLRAVDLVVGRAGWRSRRDSWSGRPLPPAGAGCCRSSAKLFHSPQSGQRPSHFELSKPQAWHAKTVLTLLIAARLPANRGSTSTTRPSLDVDARHARPDARQHLPGVVPARSADVPGGRSVAEQDRLVALAHVRHDP